MATDRMMSRIKTACALYRRSAFFKILTSGAPGLWLAAFLVIIVTGSAFLVPVSQISMKVTTRVLTKGKSISSEGELFYRAGNGSLVTRFITPQEYLVITNAVGEFSIYQLAENTVTQAKGKDYSSENSFLYYFLRNKTFDMGLGSSGFRLRNTRTEDKLLVTTWDPPLELAGNITQVELVHENHRPIYMGFIGPKGRPAQKVYYTRYEQVGDVALPTFITEIQFTAKGDSSITRRTYSGFRINSEVDTKWLDFRIPMDAKVVK